MFSSKSDIEVGFDEEDSELVNDEEENSDISDVENFNICRKIRGRGLTCCGGVCPRFSTARIYSDHRVVSCRRLKKLQEKFCVRMSHVQLWCDLTMRM
jgi:hypothetical protein